ncbi:extracellular solute-binding protein [Synechococcus sp. CS-1330]|nr:extracellular solute-binding protein [Synechococcus sp. CS-1330]
MAPPPAAQKSQRRRDRLLRLLGALALLAPLGGCTLGRELPNVLHLGVEVNPDEKIDAELRADTLQRLGGLEASYRQLQPNTRFQDSLYPEQQLEWEIKHRNRAGLGPDLLLLSGDMALRLLAAGVTAPFPQTEVDLNQFDPQVLDRLRNPSGDLAGLPLLVQTQLACFNRRRLPVAPATLEQLLDTSAKGHPVGLSMEAYNLFWTAGSFGAIDAIDTAAAGRQPSGAQQQAIERWLTWLQNANNQQRVTFYASQSSAEAEFREGKVDWFPCRSSAIPRLRKALGDGLGMAPLPSGEGGNASPINKLRVLALGTNVSRSSRKRALAFSRFSVNPLSQRNLTLGSQVALPANRFVRVPLSSSATLRAMVTSAEQGRQTNTLMALTHSNDPRLAEIQTLLTTLVFGEVPPNKAGQSLVAILRNRP